LFFPALYLIAAARFDQPLNLKDDSMLWPSYEQVFSLSLADVAALEASLESNPEDLKTRMELTAYYISHPNNETMYTKHEVWFATHHPELGPLSMTATNHALNNEESKQQIATAWEAALEKHSDSPAVISNAAAFIARTDPNRALELLAKADTLDPARHEMYREHMLTIYVAAEMQIMNPDLKVNGIEMPRETAFALSDQLEVSNDAALLAKAGKLLVEFGTGPRGDGQIAKHGFELIQQAIQLDPNNPAWKEALEWAQSEPQRMLNYANATAKAPQAGVVRIGSQVAEANLITKIDPVYPPLAKQAHIQGTVEFSIRVGEDGKVQRLNLVRGHPLLVDAAKNAVLKSVYHSVSQDGKPVPFETEVIVQFNLN
jgi:tetratricopeptide (TPR) repeat protein